MSIEKRIGNYVSKTKYNDVTSESAYIAKKSLLDSVSAMIAGTKSESADRAIDLITHSGGVRRSHIIGRSKKVPNETAAMCNTILMTSKDMGDCLDYNPYHPSLTIVPAVMALIEDKKLLGGRIISGKEFLNSIIIGQDLGIRFSLALDYSPLNIGMANTFKILGPIASLSNLLNMDSLTVCQNMGMGIGYGTMFQGQAIIEGADSVHIINGMVTYCAYLYTKLNLNRINGPADFLTGNNGFLNRLDNNYKKEYLLKDLGSYYYNNYICHKPYAASRAIHNQIDIACGLSEEVELENISKIDVHISPVIYELLRIPRNLEIRPVSSEIAELSIPFAVATALLRGNFLLDDLEPSNLNNIEVLRLARKINVVPDARCYSLQAVGKSFVNVFYEDGRVINRHSDNALGGTERPMEYHGGIDEKFKWCVDYAEFALSESEQNEFIDNIYNIEEFEDVRHVFKLIWE